MPLMLDVEWEESFLEPVRDPELERWSRRETGYPPSDGLGFLVPCPWLARAVVKLTSLALAHLEHDQADLVTLVVSRDNSCRLCYAGARNLLRIAGMRPEQIDRLEEGLLSAEEQTGPQLALDFARRLSRSNPPPGNGFDSRWGRHNPRGFSGREGPQGAPPRLREGPRPRSAEATCRPSGG